MPSAHSGVAGPAGAWPPAAASPASGPSTRRRKAPQPFACVATNSSSTAPWATNSCSSASISALSVPGRSGSHSLPRCFAVSVRRGSTTTTGTPRRLASRTRARHSQPMMQSARLAPHSTIIPEWRRVAGSIPACWVPSTTGCVYLAAAELYVEVCSTCPPMRFRKRAVRASVSCSAPRHEPEPPSARIAPSPCFSRMSARPSATSRTASGQVASRNCPEPRGPVRTSGDVRRAGACCCRHAWCPRTHPDRYGPPAGLSASRVTRPSLTVATSGQPPPQSRLQATGRVAAAPSSELVVIRCRSPRVVLDCARIPDREGRGRFRDPGPVRSGGAVSLRRSSLV
jgi:hypothetical protein